MFGNLKISPTTPGGKGISRWSSEIALPPIRSRPNCMVAIFNFLTSQGIPDIADHPGFVIIVSPAEYILLESLQ